MSDTGQSVNASNKSPMSTRAPTPTREQQTEALCKLYPVLTDQEIQQLVGPDNSQLSLLSQVQGGAISPQSVQNISEINPNLYPLVLKGLIDSLVETCRQKDSMHTMEKGLLEEALSNLQQTCPAPRVAKAKWPFIKAPPGYKENQGEVDLDLPCKDRQ